MHPELVHKVCRGELSSSQQRAGTFWLPKTVHSAPPNRLLVTQGGGKREDARLVAEEVY